MIPRRHTGFSGRLVCNMVRTANPWLEYARNSTRALRHRNYRLFFFGQGISLIGTWMQSVALSWLVYRMTGSALLLGVVGFSSQILAFIGAPVAGVVADRANRRHLLLVTQSLAMLQALLLAVLVLTGTIRVWHIITLGGMLGLVNGFDIPIRQAFVSEMLETREDLPNAIALNSFFFNGARLLGPTIGGVLIAMVGEGVCFLVNGLSFIAVLAALMAMRVKEREALASHVHPLQSFREGYRYVVGSKPIRSLLLQLAAISLLGMPYMVLMPVFAKTVLHGDARTLGFLVSGVGVGALGGALFLASRRRVRGLERTIPFAAGLLGVALIGFGLSDRLLLSIALVAVAGFGMMVQNAGANTLVQTLVDDDKRGRVMGFYTMAFVGTAPFGSLLAGSLASRIGAPWTLVCAGSCCLTVATVFGRKATAPVASRHQ